MNKKQSQTLAENQNVQVKVMCILAEWFQIDVLLSVNPILDVPLRSTKSDRAWLPCIQGPSL